MVLILYYTRFVIITYANEEKKKLCVRRVLMISVKVLGSSEMFEVLIYLVDIRKYYNNTFYVKR